MNGAQALLRTLVAADVDVCFANPGTSEMHFVAALDAVPEMRPVLCLFEGVATGAADGYARMADRPAATLLHLGPGLTNALANVHNARKARVPMLNIIGEHATYHQAYDAPLSSDIEGLARPLSHFLRTSRMPASVARDAADAVAAARTPPGRIASLILPAERLVERGRCGGGRAADPARLARRGRRDRHGRERAAERRTLRAADERRRAARETAGGRERDRRPLRRAAARRHIHRTAERGAGALRSSAFPTSPRWPRPSCSRSST